MRLRVYVMVALMVLLPAAALAWRWHDPSLGQIRGGWQMHTDCWGRADPCR